MNASAPRLLCTHPIRVYWEDTDAGGIVYYANFLRYFERARTEWLRTIGVDQRGLRERDGVMFVVADARITYRAPARLDDQLHVSVALREAGRASLVLEQTAQRDGTLLADGEVRIGCVDAASWRPQRIPRAIVEAIDRA
jgi:acyl-CoA thioester hydrolase